MVLRCTDTPITNFNVTLREQVEDGKQVVVATEKSRPDIVAVGRTHPEALGLLFMMMLGMVDLPPIPKGGGN